ncbi:hypothetical protein MNEG_13809, partial [Monoraphidium neglectum]
MHRQRILQQPEPAETPRPVSAPSPAQLPRAAPQPPPVRLTWPLAGWQWGLLVIAAFSMFIASGAGVGG